MNKIKKPVFIVGSERSGTTLFRLMLDSHKDIAVCPEFEYAVDPIAENDHFPGLSELKDLENNWIFKSENIKLNYKHSWSINMREALNQIAISKNKSQPCAIVHKNFDQILKIWKDAVFIHILRDPRDVAKSVQQMGWAGDVVTGVERWIHAESCWDKIVEKVPEKNRFEIKFENLIKYPNQTLNNVCDFIGIETDEEMLKYNITSTYKLPETSICQSWKFKLKNSELSRLEFILKPWLKKRGYTPSGIKPRNMSLIYKALLPVKDWVARFKKRRDLYGIGLLLEDWWSRHMPTTTSWRNKINNRMCSIWKCSLK